MRARTPRRQQAGWPAVPRRGLASGSCAGGEHWQAAATPFSELERHADLGGAGGGSHPLGFLFINVDLTVVLPRDPAGDWLLLDAVTTIGDKGTGLAETSLSDVHGSCGTALQTLLVAPR
jgi:hypothetical protein